MDPQDIIHTTNWPFLTYTSYFTRARHPPSCRKALPVARTSRPSGRGFPRSKAASVGVPAYAIAVTVYHSGKRSKRASPQRTPP